MFREDRKMKKKSHFPFQQVDLTLSDSDDEVVPVRPKTNNSTNNHTNAPAKAPSATPVITTNGRSRTQ